jgi:hypothetical protein
LSIYFLAHAQLEFVRSSWGLSSASCVFPNVKLLLLLSSTMCPIECNLVQYSSDGLTLLRSSSSSSIGSTNNSSSSSSSRLSSYFYLLFVYIFQK